MLLVSCGNDPKYWGRGQAVRIQPARAQFVLGPIQTAASLREWNQFQNALTTHVWHGFDWRANHPTLVAGSNLQIYPYNDRFRFNLYSSEGYLFVGEIHRRNPRMAFRPVFRGMILSVFQPVRTPRCRGYLPSWRMPLPNPCFIAMSPPRGNPIIYGSLGQEEDLGKVLTLEIQNPPLEMWGQAPEKLEFLQTPVAKDVENF